MHNQNLIYGLNSVALLMQEKPEKVKEIFIAKDNKRCQAILALAQSNGISVQKIDSHKLDTKCGSSQHQGIAANVMPIELLDERDLLAICNNAEKPLLLILDEIQDPHNFGACLRTAEAAGVDAVVFPQNNSANISATVRKVASGAADLLPLVQVKNLARAMQAIKQLGIWIVGTSLDTDQTIYQLDLNMPLAIVVGREGEGLRDLTAKNCDYLAQLPMFGRVQSLNVSVATGICVFEALRQRSN